MNNRDTYQVALLNPTVTNLQNARSDYNDSDATGLVEGLFGEYGQITDAYSYADGSFIGSMTQEDMENYFQTIFDSLGDLGVNTDVGESTGERNRITYFETLGEGVQFTGKMTLTVPTYKVENNEVLPVDIRVYTLTAYTAEGDPLDPANGPAYIEGGGVVTFKVTGVSVNGVPANLDDSNSYDKAAQENLSITVRQLSDGMRQMQVDIPPELMAYNVFITKSESGGTVYDYYEATQPLQLTYGVKMRADVETAGSYLVSAPTRSYVHFIPSSAQTVEGIYDMPYYWPGGQFARDQAQFDKNGTGVAGASDYVTAATKGNNNDVYIYLGNNGLYTLEGKQLTFHLFWDDADNQDGKRPEQITVQLYRESVNDENDDGAISAPANAVAYGSEIILTSSNAVQGDQKQWEYTTEDVPVYANGGEFYRYWLKITETPEYDYTDDLNASGEHNFGLKRTGNDGSTWYCFSLDNGLLTDAKLDVKLSHTPETIEYNITKEWDISTGDASTTVDSVQVQLYANAVPVNKNGTTEGNTDPFEITQGKNWTETLTLPRCSEGVEISYTLVEQGDQYTAIVDSQRDADTGDYTATITNYSNVDKTNFTAIKTWNDADNQDGIRPESVTFTLTAKTADESELEADDLGLSSLEATVTANNNWRYTWTDLPKTVNGQAVTYGVSEEIPDGYSVSYNYNVPGYAFVTNTHPRPL